MSKLVFVLMVVSLATALGGDEVGGMDPGNYREL